MKKDPRSTDIVIFLPCAICNHDSSLSHETIIQLRTPVAHVEKKKEVCQPSTKKLNVPCTRF